MSTGRVNPGLINTAAGVIDAAWARGNREPYSIAFELDAAGLLQSPETAAELEQLRARVTELEAEQEKLIRWHREDGKALTEVRGKFAEAAATVAQLVLERGERMKVENALRDQVAELEGAANCPSQITTSLGASECALPVRHRGDHRNAEKNHYWSDEFAVRQAEDPHDSPLHHTYAVAHDLPEVTA